jgi:hypothetical protein
MAFFLSMENLQSALPGQTAKAASPYLSLCGRQGIGAHIAGSQGNPSGGHGQPFAPPETLSSSLLVSFSTGFSFLLSFAGLFLLSGIFYSPSPVYCRGSCPSARTRGVLGR